MAKHTQQEFVDELNALLEKHHVRITAETDNYDYEAYDLHLTFTRWKLGDNENDFKIDLISRQGGEITIEAESPLEIPEKAKD